MKANLHFRENTVHANNNTPMDCLVEYEEVTTTTKRWFYHRPRHCYIKPKALKNGKVLLIYPAQGKGGTEDAKDMS